MIQADSFQSFSSSFFFSRLYYEMSRAFIFFCSLAFYNNCFDCELLMSIESVYSGTGNASVFTKSILNLFLSYLLYDKENSYNIFKPLCRAAVCSFKDTIESAEINNTVDHTKSAVCTQWKSFWDT